jgi:peptidase MA superfamily protein
MEKGLLLGLLIYATSPSLAEEPWQVLEHPPVRITYQKGNGSEAQILADQAGGVLRTVESDLGVKLQGPLEVRILPSEGGPDAGAAEGAPHWAVGFVRGGSREVVLKGSWVRTYPFGDLLSLFGHETTHILLDTVPGAQTFPRWFHEGVAVMESRHWSFSDAFTLGSTLLVGRPVPLAQLSVTFPAEDAAARAAYAESFHFVSYLEREHGPGVARRILEKMQGGASFPEAFSAVAGRPLPEEEVIWRDRVSFAYRWIPALTSTGVLWMVTTLLVLLGRLARIRRDRRLLESWKLQGLD